MPERIYRSSVWFYDDYARASNEARAARMDIDENGELFGVFG